MTNQEAIEILRANTKVGYLTSPDSLRIEIHTDSELLKALKMAEEALENFKSGQWQSVNPFVDTIQCSVCGYQLQSEELKTPYCAWCGAKMKSEVEDT